MKASYIIANTKHWAIQPDPLFLFRIEHHFYSLKFKVPFTNWVILTPVHHQWFDPTHPLQEKEI